MTNLGARRCCLIRTGLCLTIAAACACSSDLKPAGTPDAAWAPVGDDVHPMADLTSVAPENGQDGGPVAGRDGAGADDLLSGDGPVDGSPCQSACNDTMPLCDPGSGQCVPCHSSAQCPAEAPVCDRNGTCRFSVAGIWRGKFEDTGTTIRMVASETDIVSFNTAIVVRYAGDSCPLSLALGSAPAPITGKTATLEVRTGRNQLGLAFEMDLTFTSPTTAHGSGSDLVANGLICDDGISIGLGNPSATIAGPFSFDLQCQRCGGECIDTTTDVNHCGSCDNACHKDQWCVDGA